MKKSRSCHSISILVVDDDTTCLSFVAALLKKLKYEVVTAKHPNDALCALRIKGGAFDLVVSDVHMPDMNGFELQEAIAHEFNLPVVLMSVDSKEVVVSKGMKSGAAFFISKPVSPNDLKDLWQFASMRKKVDHDVNEGKNLNSKRKPASASEAGCKKPKVIWTNALHCRFLEAIRTIGLHRSVPKKILEAMNVPGLTRENVASHLQKYRIFLKRVSDASCKLEFGGDEGFLSNYSSSTTASNSLLMLNKLQDFGDFPAADTPRFSCRVPPCSSLVDQAHQGGLLEPSITTAAVNFDAPSHVGTDIVSAWDPTNYIKGLAPEGDTDFYSNEWQNMSIVGLDELPQCLGDSCFVGDGLHLSDVVGDYQDDHLLLQPSNLVQDQSQLCSMENLPAFDVMATQQPLEAAHVDSNLSDEVNFQNLVQNGCECDYTASFFIYGGINYNDQPFYQEDQESRDCVEFGTTSQFNKAIEQQGEDDDDGLESLLAYGLFGADEIQTLEGI